MDYVSMNSYVLCSCNMLPLGGLAEASVSSCKYPYRVLSPSCHDTSASTSFMEDGGWRMEDSVYPDIMYIVRNAAFQVLTSTCRTVTFP
jgi:hypothetical protein